MPTDYTTHTAMQLLNDLAPYTLNQTATIIVNELKSREIKEGDSDNTAQVKGGIRPEHTPRVP